MNINRIGVDLAKQVFHLCGVDRLEAVVLRKQLRRAQMYDFLKLGIHVHRLVKA